MKAVPFVLAALLAGGVAHAQPVDPYPPAPPVATRPIRPLRAAVIAAFDRDGDGRLDAAERHQAIRALRRVVRRLAHQQLRARARAARLRGVIQRYDLDGDGNVGPAEAPPALQRRLRRLDRNRDGWVDDRDF